MFFSDCLLGNVIDFFAEKGRKVKLLRCGGPNGELGASLRYLSQRYTMPDDVTKGLLTDIGTEELGHLEMVGTLVAQLSKGVPPKEWSEMQSYEYYADNGASVFPQSSQGAPFTAASIAVTGDPLTNLYEDLAAEQKARAVYDNILKLSDEPDVNDVIKFLRQREVTHFQRFGEANHTNLRRISVYKTCLDNNRPSTYSIKKSQSHPFEFRKKFLNPV